MRLYFGDIPPVPPITRPGVWIPRHAEDRRATMQDRVPQARLYRAWTGPVWGSTDAQYLALAAAVLAGDKNSRLYQRLVYRERLASDVSLDADAFEISGVTDLEASAQPGVELATIEKAVDEELQAFMRQGPDAARKWNGSPRSSARHSCAASSRWAAISGKAGILAESMMFGGSPDTWKRDLEVIDLGKARGPAPRRRRVARPRLLHAERAPL